MNPDRLTGTIAIAVLPQDNGQSVCQLSPALSDRARDDIQCSNSHYGFDDSGQ